MHRWTVEAVRRTRIGTLHVVANTQDWLDDQLAQWIELGAIVGEPPTVWAGPLSIDVTLTGELLDLKYAALAAQASQTEAVRGGGRREALPRDHPESSDLRPSRRERAPVSPGGEQLLLLMSNIAAMPARPTQKESGAR